VPIGLCDVLEFVESPGQFPNITITGMKIYGNPDENLVIGAWQLMHTEYDISAIDIHLHKVIPLSAGLGGGSSDAAFMLLGLNRYFKCRASSAELENMAGQLGSDCAFFIRNQPALATGRGELLETIQLSLKDCTILLVNPGIHISTREAYSNVVLRKQEKSLKELLNQPITDWQGLIINDFEESVFAKHPEIKQIKDKLLDAGAVYTAMSGSGSTVYGIFNQSFNKEQLAAWFSGYFVWQGIASAFA
jgi:4-diphosphocytidyl-2-C-methyl-D-erythritol kinase